MQNYFLLFLPCALFLFVSCSTDKQESTPPNIIFVLADDLGYGDISAFNEAGKIQTPHIDQLVADGLLFSDAHASSSVCTPTRYGILTGRYNWRTRLKRGVLSGSSKALIPNDRTTVASLLKKAGYSTAYIGKWHLGWDWALRGIDSLDGEVGKNFENVDFSQPVTNTPNDLGFDYAYGHSGSLDMAPYVYVENRQPTQVPDTMTQDTSKYGWWRQGPTAPDFVHTDVTPNFFRRAFDYVEEQAKTENPFFLYLPLPSPHTPILPTEDWQEKSSLNPYADFVLMIDDYMGQLQQVIQKAGIEDNTLVIFTSDNGCSPEADFELLAQKGHQPSSIYRGHKADIFEGGHRVPFIVKWPAKIEKGAVSDETICTTDLLATVADITGLALSADEGEDSYSLVPLFEHPKPDNPLREATVHHSINGSFAIRKGDWKLLLCPDSGGWSYPSPRKDQAVIDTLPPIQLYNLKDDSGETTNLHAHHPEVVAELQNLLATYITQGRSTPGPAQENDPIDFEWKQAAFVKQ